MWCQKVDRDVLSTLSSTTTPTLPPSNNDRNGGNVNGASIGDADARRNVLDILSGNSFTHPNILYLSVKLDENNYIIWRDYIISFSMAYRFEGFINSSLPLPNQFLDQEKNTKVWHACIPYDY